ncbi:HTH-type transcriptional regulator CymR [bacterium HR34]|nr:HTH-type transcriptional regulator CymR [bacterium HR34]
MKISSKLHYGVIILTRLAQSKRPMTAKEIAEIERLPKAYVEKLMKQLRKSGMLKSSRGRGKGYELAKNKKSITMLDIAKALGENINLVACLENSFLCPKSKSCSSEYLWREVKKAIEKTLKNITLNKLSKKYAKN